jgi:hypothetical protein
MKTKMKLVKKVRTENPAVEQFLWESNGRFIVTSFNGSISETMAFESNKKGVITDWMDLACIKSREHEKCAEIAFSRSDFNEDEDETFEDEDEDEDETFEDA